MYRKISESENLIEKSKIRVIKCRIIGFIVKIEKKEKKNQPLHFLLTFFQSTSSSAKQL